MTTMPTDNLKTAAPRKGRLAQRLFAWMIAHEGANDPATDARKRALFGRLRGAILEIGPGAGSNLRFLSPDSLWVGVEPNPYMIPYLRRAIQAQGGPTGRFSIDPGDPQGIRLPAGDASLDAVISTLVMCSVTDPAQTLQEILRVLKPGGRFAFIEHVAAPTGTRLRSAQDLIQPLWSVCGDGCHPNRETGNAIARAGFSRVELEDYTISGAWLAGPHIAGVAVK
jgi:SAM-dependent methyltransferase